MIKVCQLTLSYQGSYCSTTGRLLVHIPNTDFVYTEGIDNISVCRSNCFSKKRTGSVFEMHKSHCNMTDSSFPLLSKTYRWGSKSITASFCKTCGIQVVAESRAEDFMFGKIGINVSVRLVLMLLALYDAALRSRVNLRS